VFGPSLPWRSEKVGAVYITHSSEIGIGLLNPGESVNGHSMAEVALKMFIDLLDLRPPFYANIAPGNERSKKFFKRLGYKLIQETYEYDKA